MDTEAAIHSRIQSLNATIDVLQKDQEQRLRDFAALSIKAQEAPSEPERQASQAHAQAIMADYTRVEGELEELKHQQAQFELAEPNRSTERLDAAKDALEHVLEARQEGPAATQDANVLLQAQENVQTSVGLPGHDPLESSFQHTQQPAFDVVTNGLIGMGAGVMLVKETIDERAGKLQQESAEREARAAAERELAQREEQKREALEALELEYGDKGLEVEASQLKRQNEFENRHERLDTDPAIRKGLQERLDEQFKAEWDALEAERKAREKEILEQAEVERQRVEKDRDDRGR